MRITLNNKEIELTDEEVALIVEKATREEWRNGEMYCYIDHAGYVNYSRYEDDEVDKERIEIGNAFKEKSQAERELERIKIKVRLWKWAKDNAPFEPDWSNIGQNKYVVSYDCNHSQLSIDTRWLNKLQTELPYFKSSEDVQRFIKENESDLIYWFCK